MLKLSKVNDSLFNCCNSCHRATVSNASPINKTVDQMYKVEMKGLMFLACEDCLKELAQQINEIVK